MRMHIYYIFHTTVGYRRTLNGPHRFHVEKTDTYQNESILERHFLLRCSSLLCSSQCSRHHLCTAFNLRHISSSSSSCLCDLLDHIPWPGDENLLIYETGSSFW